MPELVMDMSVVCCCLFIPDALLEIISLQNEHPNIKQSLIRNSIQARCLLNLKKGQFFFSPDKNILPGCLLQREISMPDYTGYVC